MGIEKKRPILSTEVYDDFTKQQREDGFTLEECFKIYYAQKTLIPVALKGEIPVNEIEVAKKRLTEFCEILDKHNLLYKIAA